jgi:small nuclear ribonucleoprotein G
VCKEQTADVPVALAARVFVFVSVKLNGSRQVSGVLRGFDQFMNLVLEDTVEITGTAETDRQKIGMVVLRGNSVLMIECLEKL